MFRLYQKSLSGVHKINAESMTTYKTINRLPPPPRKTEISVLHYYRIERAQTEIYQDFVVKKTGSCIDDQIVIRLTDTIV